MPRKFIPKKSDLEIYNEDIQKQLKYALGKVSMQHVSPSLGSDTASSSAWGSRKLWKANVGWFMREIETDDFIGLVTTITVSVGDTTTVEFLPPELIAYKL